MVLKGKNPGLSLLEIAMLMVLTGVALSPIVTMRADSLRTGQVIKITTERLIIINSLLEQANGGVLQGEDPTSLFANLNNLPDSNLSATYTTANFIPIPTLTPALNSAQQQYYKWRVTDISEGPTVSDAIRTPDGMRLYNISLLIYKNNDPADPGNQIDAINTIAQVNHKQRLAIAPGLNQRQIALRIIDGYHYDVLTP